MPKRNTNKTPLTNDVYRKNLATIRTAANAAADAEARGDFVTAHTQLIEIARFLGPTKHAMRAQRKANTPAKVPAKRSKKSDSAPTEPTVAQTA